MMFHACKNLGEWLNRLAEFREGGQTLSLSDDPKKRLLGFFDGDTRYTIPLIWVSDRSVRWDSDEQRDQTLARLGMTDQELSGALKTGETRARLVAMVLPPIGD